MNLGALAVVIGATFILGFLIGNIFTFIIRLLFYSFDKREYTHAKWKTLFPFIFKNEYRECLSKGVYLVHTNVPGLSAWVGIGNMGGYSVRREYTKEYLESEGYAKLKKFSDSLKIK